MENASPPPWLCMQIEERNVSSDSWHFVSAVASESIFICLEERLAPRLEKHRQTTQGSGFWLPAREGATQQSMLGVMTKNNGVLPHNWGSSIMISLPQLELYFTLKSNWNLLAFFSPTFQIFPVNCVTNNQNPNERHEYLIFSGFMIVPTVCAVWEWLHIEITFLHNTSSNLSDSVDCQWLAKQQDCFCTPTTGVIDLHSTASVRFRQNNLCHYTFGFEFNNHLVKKFSPQMHWYFFLALYTTWPDFLLCWCHVHYGCWRSPPGKRRQ